MVMAMRHFSATVLGLKQAVVNMSAVHMSQQTVARPPVCLQLGMPFHRSSLPFQPEILHQRLASKKVAILNVPWHSGAHRRLRSCSTSCTASEVEALPVPNEDIVEAGDDFKSKALISSREQVIFNFGDRE